MNNSKPKITFLDKETFPTYATFPRPHFDHTWEEFPFTDTEKILTRSSESDILIVNKVRLGVTILEKLPRLKFIALTATGSDNIDLNYCNENNILVSNVVDYGIDSVVEHTFTLIFSLIREIDAYRKTVKAGNWQKSKYFSLFPKKISELKNKKLGIIGPGSLGQGVAKIGKALGMDITFVGRPSKDYDINYPLAPLGQILEKSDIISIHCPLTSQTKNLITLKELKLMKKSSLIINTARGGIVNENDLKTALETNLIAGAGIDVLSQEPPKEGNPLLEIIDHPRLIITPHVAWGGETSVNTLIKKVIKNIENFIKGSPTSLVTKKL